MSSRAGYRSALGSLITLIVLAFVGIPALSGPVDLGVQRGAEVFGYSAESAPADAAEHDAQRAPVEIPGSAYDGEPLIRAGSQLRAALAALAVLLGAGAALWSARGTRGPPRRRDPRAVRAGRDILKDHCVNLC